MIQRIDDLREPPIVGRFYMVPTVRYTWRQRVSDWPVIGPRHNDAVLLNFKPMHYHVDGRFITNAEYAWLEGNSFFDDGNIGTDYIFAAFPLAWNASGHQSPRDEEESEPHPPVIWRRKRCARQSVKYPSEKQWYSWGIRLARAYENASALTEDGRLVCPHRQAPIGSLVPDKHGVVICPLHGLAWNAKTGEPAQCPGWR